MKRFLGCVVVALAAVGVGVVSSVAIPSGEVEAASTFDNPEFALLPGSKNVDPLKVPDYFCSTDGSWPWTNCTENPLGYYYDTAKAIWVNPAITPSKNANGSWNNGCNLPPWNKLWDNGSAVGQIKREVIIDRALDWVNNNVPYCKGFAYRSWAGTYTEDCVGFVGMSWGVRKYTLVDQHVTAITVTSAAGLEAALPGDGISKPGHRMLVASNSTTTNTMQILEEPGAGPTYPGNRARYYQGEAGSDDQGKNQSYAALFAAGYTTILRYGLAIDGAKLPLPQLSDFSLAKNTPSSADVVVTDGVAPSVAYSVGYGGGSYKLIAKGIESTGATIEEHTLGTTPALAGPVTIAATGTSVDNSASPVVITLPANNSTADRVYRFHLTLSARDNGQKPDTRLMEITVPHAPAVTGLSVDRTSVTDKGGVVRFTATAESTVSEVVFSVSPAVNGQSAFARPVYGGVASLTLDLPENSSATLRSYKVVATPSGSTGQTKSVDVGVSPVAGGFVAVGQRRVSDVSIGSGVEWPFVVNDEAGVPLVASAVMVNVAVVAPAANGHLRLYACGSSLPGTASVNFVAGTTVANSVLVTLGEGSELCMWSTTSSPVSVRVILDLHGYVRPGVGGLFNPIAPARLMDTRTGNVPYVGGEARAVTVTGAGGVPASGVSAVSVMATVVNPSLSGYAIVYPAGVDGCSTRPGVSTVNYVAAAPAVSNTQFIAVGVGGQVCVFSTSAAHVILDVSGWFGATGAGYVPMVSTREFDSASEDAPHPGNDPKMVELRLDDSSAGYNPNAVAVNANIAVVPPVALGGGNVVAYAADAPKPLTTSVNYSAGVVKSTTAQVPIGTIASGGRGIRVAGTSAIDGQDPATNVRIIIDTSGIWVPVAA